MVSTPLKNISQNGNLPQIGVKIKNLWNHHLASWCNHFVFGIFLGFQNCVFVCLFAYSSVSLSLSLSLSVSWRSTCSLCFLLEFLKLELNSCCWLTITTIYVHIIYVYTIIIIYYTVNFESSCLWNNWTWDMFEQFWVHILLWQVNELTQGSRVVPPGFHWVNLPIWLSCFYPSKNGEEWWKLQNRPCSQ